MSDGNDTALIVIDMLNSYEHEDAERLTESVEQVLPNMVTLVQRAKELGLETVFVNDNFGEWSQTREQLVERVMKGRFPQLVEPIAPAAETSFVVKARHSAFYETPLEYLLRQGGIRKVVLVGQVTEQCILYSALDAYIRHFDVVVPPDAVACIDEDLARAALQMMERNMRAELTPTESCLTPAA
jgi:nicotinamidase-related amidase